MVLERGRREVLPTMLPLARLHCGCWGSWSETSSECLPIGSFNEPATIEPLCGLLELAPNTQTLALLTRAKLVVSTQEGVAATWQCIRPRSPESCWRHPQRRPQTQSSHPQRQSRDVPCHLDLGIITRKRTQQHFHGTLHPRVMPLRVPE